jgi:hypothetical protein
MHPCFSLVVRKKGHTTLNSDKFSPFTQVKQLAGFPGLPYIDSIYGCREKGLACLSSMTNQISHPLSRAWTSAAVAIMLQSMEDLMPKKQLRAWLSSAAIVLQGCDLQGIQAITSTSESTMLTQRAEIERGMPLDYFELKEPQTKTFWGRGSSKKLQKGRIA